MEGKCKVGLSDSSSSVNCHSEELRIVNLTIVIEVDALENLIDLLGRHIELIEGISNLAQL